MIRFILSLFRPFRWLIENMGADYNQFIRILQLKLTIDDRRTQGFLRKSSNAQGKMLIKQAVGQIFIGAFFSLFLIIVKSPFTFYYFSHSFIMAMMAMMIISEFTTILFDTSENVIIQPLPIKGNTISLARNAHIFIYLTMMAFNLSVLSIIIAFYKFGIASGLIFVFTLFLNVLFTLFLTNILYLGIMRLVSGEQLKNLLMYFQIFIAIFFMAAYQFGLKLVDKVDIQNMVLSVHWYTYLVPPAFFSGFTEALSTLNFDQSHTIFLIEALTIPLFAFYLSGKYLTPVFNRKLMDLEQSDRNSKVKIESSGNGIWHKIISPFFVFNIQEKAAFNLMWKMAGRERLFKQTLLPTFGYVIIFILVQFISHPISLSELALSNSYLIFLYSFILIALTLPSALQTGNNKDAAWIFKALPMNSPANFFKGSIKAAFAKFFVPFYLLIGIVVCSIWGIKVLPDIIIALLAIYLGTLATYYFNNLSFPFSMEKIASQGGANFIRMLGLMIPAVALGFLHKYLLHFQFANLILIPFYISAILYVNRRMVYQRITWREVDRSNNF